MKSRILFVMALVAFFNPLTVMAADGVLGEGLAKGNPKVMCGERNRIAHENSVTSSADAVLNSGRRTQSAASAGGRP